jgi:hypothetical protein
MATQSERGNYSNCPRRQHSYPKKRLFGSPRKPVIWKPNPPRKGIPGGLVERILNLDFEVFWLPSSKITIMLRAVTVSLDHMKSSQFFVIAAAVSTLSWAPVLPAAIYDLNASGTIVVPTAYGNAIFTTDFTQTAGSGTLDPFLTIQANGVEEGYNSSTANFDTKREPQYNHELQLSELTISTIAGVEYYSFLLDIDESNSAANSMISLDALKIYTSATLQGAVTDVDTLGTKRFDLDLPMDSFIKYDDLNSGSGQADIAFFIPTSAFLTASPTDYVYMYQKFGSSFTAGPALSTDSGFEETRLAGDLVIVPEVGSLVPLIAVLGAVLGGPFVRRGFGKLNRRAT